MFSPFICVKSRQCLWFRRRAVSVRGYHSWEKSVCRQLFAQPLVMHLFRVSTRRPRDTLIGWSAAGCHCVVFFTRANTQSLLVKLQINVLVSQLAHSEQRGQMVSQWCNFLTLRQRCCLRHNQSDWSHMFTSWYCTWCSFDRLKHSITFGHTEKD